LFLGVLFTTCTGFSQGDSARSVREMNRGIGQLERYDYKAALESFSPLVKLHPKWLAAHINLGLAALNLQEPSYLKQAEASF